MQNPLYLILLYGGMFALMYFLLIRPNKKKSQAAKEMRDNLKIGDQIITIGGFNGKIVKLGDDDITVDFNGTSILIKRWAVGSVL
ncbi:MAG TPA: preprotein translocase subunit YajC [Clostridia bacterium]|nr:preprotein translocase subunit YajC [Clostridia bacterium]